MTGDQLRTLVQAAGGRGTWEYYRPNDRELVVAIVADLPGKTITHRVGVPWADLATLATGFESVRMARERDVFARTLKLPKGR